MRKRFVWFVGCGEGNVYSGCVVDYVGSNEAGVFLFSCLGLGWGIGEVAGEVWIG